MGEIVGRTESGKMGRAMKQFNGSSIDYSNYILSKFFSQYVS
jgi:hypothetical protein